MKKAILLFTIYYTIFTVYSFAQVGRSDKARFKETKEGSGYYYETIMKDIHADEAKQESPKVNKIFQMDFSGVDLPNKFDLYKTEWHNKPISQGNTGTCWDFSTTSFFETEIYRLSKKQVKLSEMFVVYWEYIEKAKRFINERGNSTFEEGSEGNAVTRIYKDYGIVPLSAYDGKTHSEKFYNHSIMFAELKSYLQSLKRDNNWNLSEAISTIKSILDHYMGAPPSQFTFDSKQYTPKSFLKDYLRLNMDDYIDILSIMQEPFWQKVEYKVEDNWWHSGDYYNVPVDDFIKIIKSSIRSGYTIAIGGDISEPGFSRDKQVAVIPSFDIPSAYIDDNSRQMRFSNKTTTDDHGMHLVGYYEFQGKDWFLIKDSGSGSRNNDINAKEFGYYFMNEDYLKLKIMDITLHKDAAKDILQKFK